MAITWFFYINELIIYEGNETHLNIKKNVIVIRSPS